MGQRPEERVNVDSSWLMQGSSSSDSIVMSIKMEQNLLRTRGRLRFSWAETDFTSTRARRVESVSGVGSIADTYAPLYLAWIDGPLIRRPIYALGKYKN